MHIWWQGRTIHSEESTEKYWTFQIKVCAKKLFDFINKFGQIQPSQAVYKVNFPSSSTSGGKDSPENPVQQANPPHKLTRRCYPSLIKRHTEYFWLFSSYSLLGFNNTEGWNRSSSLCLVPFYARASATVLRGISSAPGEEPEFFSLAMSNQSPSLRSSSSSGGGRAFVKIQSGFWKETRGRSQDVFVSDCMKCGNKALTCLHARAHSGVLWSASSHRGCTSGDMLQELWTRRAARLDEGESGRKEEKEEEKEEVSERAYVWQRDSQLKSGREAEEMGRLVSSDANESRYFPFLF